MTGRTLFKFSRVYLGGYDVSGYTRSYGPLTWEFDPVELTTLTDAVKGYLPGDCNIGIANVNAVMDAATASQLYGSMRFGVAPSTARVVTIAIGDRAAPTQGDPSFNGYLQQIGFNAAEDAGAVVVNIPFGGWGADDLEVYRRPWGNVLNANVTRIAVNAAVGYDSGLVGGTAFGGFMVYHVTAGAGTGQIKVQHSTVANLDANFGDLGGCDTGVISFATPTSGIIPTTNATTTVGQWLRWQVVFTAGGPSVTFVLSFVRARSAWGA